MQAYIKRSQRIRKELFRMAYSFDTPVTALAGVGRVRAAAFAKLGIPIIWYHTDAHPDYHLPGDHPERLNWPKLVDITKASFLAFWKLANEKY